MSPSVNTSAVIPRLCPRCPPHIFIYITLHLPVLAATAVPSHHPLSWRQCLVKSRQSAWQTDSLIDAFHFAPEINALPHTDRHTGGLFGKIPGHLFQSGTAGLRTPAIQLMSLCESINLSTKPYFVGQKAFSIVVKDRGGGGTKRWVRERPREWKEKIVTITL